MEILIKIIVSVLNSVCYVVTLLYPCDVTVFTLLPSIITSGMWLIESAKRIGAHKWNIILVSFASLMAGVCLFLGFTSTIGVSAGQVGAYYFEFRPTLALIGGKIFSYNIFVGFAIALFLGLTLPELILFSKGNIRQANAIGSFDSMIDQAIGKAN